MRASPPDLSFDVETSRLASQPIEIRRGETVTLTPRFLLNSAVLPLTNSETCVLYYRSTDMTTGLYYAITGAVHNATNGQARVTWTAANCPTATNLQADFVVASSNVINLRAYANITLRDSVFAQASTVTNPPTVTAADLSVLTGQVAGTLINAPDLAWDVESSALSVKPLQIRRGETVTLTPRFLLNSAVVSLTNTAQAALYYRASNMTTGHFYAAAGTLHNATNGQVRINWTSANCPTSATNLQGEIIVLYPGVTNLRAAVSITLQDSVFGSALTASDPQDWRLIDWSSVSNLNLSSAPFALSAGALIWSNIGGDPASSTSLAAYIQSQVGGISAGTATQIAQIVAATLMSTGNCASASAAPWSGITGIPSVWPGTATDTVARADATNALTQATNALVHATNAEAQVVLSTQALAVVAHTGAYGDLSGTPSIPSTNGLDTVAARNLAIAASTQTIAGASVSGEVGIANSAGTAGYATSAGSAAAAEEADYFLGDSGMEFMYATFAGVYLLDYENTTTAWIARWYERELFGTWYVSNLTFRTGATLTGMPNVPYATSAGSAANSSNLNGQAASYYMAASVTNGAASGTNLTGSGFVDGVLKSLGSAFTGAGTQAVQVVVSGVLATGTASNASNLGGVAAANYVTNNAAGVSFSATTTLTNLVVNGAQTNQGTLTLSKQAIVFAETADDNIGLESVTYPIGTAQTNSAWLGYGTLYQSPGSYNSAMGMNALYQAPGSQNSAMGYNALRSSPGSQNSAMGYAALYQATGSYNSAMGHIALSSSAGSFNSAMGYAALRLAAGNYNFAGGYQSGYRSGGTSNLFLGANAAYTSTGTNYYTNAIAIGAGSVPLGNNSMVLGNAQTATTEIKGNVGIGTNTPAGKLHVSSNIVLSAITGDPAAFAGGAQLYSKANGTTNDLYCQDGAGNVTLLGTHEGLTHVAYSYNRFTGEGRSINLDALAEAVQQLTGRTDILRKLTVPRADWNAEEAARLDRERLAFERAEDVAENEANAPLAAWDSQTPEDRKGPRPSAYVRRKYVPSAPRPKPAWLVEWEAAR